MTMSNAPSSDVHERSWTKAEYYRLAELGFFRGQRVELIGGSLMVMSPQGAPHALGLVLVTNALTSLIHLPLHVRCQLPLDLGASTEPEPDIAVVDGPPRRFGTAHPTTAVLIVEVSDTTLAYDRGRKGSLYASVGIADYWIVNLVTPQVEVYRDPVPDPAQPFGFRYAQRVEHRPGDHITPLAVPGVTIPVVDLLP
jgi:Uma2 family endonuclease